MRGGAIAFKSLESSIRRKRWISRTKRGSSPRFHFGIKQGKAASPREKAVEVNDALDILSAMPSLLTQPGTVAPLRPAAVQLHPGSEFVAGQTATPPIPDPETFVAPSANEARVLSSGAERNGNAIVRNADGRFLSVDNTRFWCMVAVVAVHCARVFTLSASQDSLAFYIATTLFKFGSVGFFVVSGFLLRSSLETRTASYILSRRFQKVFLPWLIWSLLYLMSLVLSDYTQHRAPFLPGFTLNEALISEGSKSLTTTSLWFVPNLFLSLGVLLLFRRYLTTVVFGAVLLAANLFYAANIYTQWVPPQHTRAAFGFIFYLWLGHYAATHLGAFNRLLTSLSARILLSLTLCAVVLSLAEARLLLHLHLLDPLNTLRLSNQLFSVLVVLCLCKLPRPTWPGFVDVPRHTFGIYLSHALIVAFILTVIRRMLELPAAAVIAHNLLPRILLWIAATTLAWTAGFLLSRSIAAQPSLCWLQGVSPLSRRTERDRSPASLALT